MDSQIQCPVCTLYLHVGMNLQDHLNTHPKEQVISALVNMTLLQQRANDENSNNFECSRYEPLADDLYTEKPMPNVSATFQNQQQSITYFTPISSQQTSHKVMIVNGTQMFHDRSTKPPPTTSATTSPATPRQLVAKSLPPLSIPTRTFRLIPAKSYEGKITQAIPPPPPYHASIQDSLTVRNAIQRNEINQITTQIQQSCSTNVFNVTTQATSSSTSSSSSTLTANINSADIPVYMQKKSIKSNGNDKSDESTTVTPMETDPHPDDQESNGQSNNNDVSDDPNISSNEKQIDCTTTSLSNDMDLENMDSINNANQTEQTPDKRTKGLKVLSNVQVSPNTILNVSQVNETIPMNNMIIVGSIPSTSSAGGGGGSISATTSQQILSPQSVKSQSLLKCSSEPYKSTNVKSLKVSKGKTDNTTTESVGNADKSLTTDEELLHNQSIPSNLSMEQTGSDECFVKPCSSKATSVIRLATQKLIKPTTSTAENGVRQTIKPPYNRQVKKLIVKLKKPFVPVIEEEANLHPPETSDSITEIIKQEQVTDEPNRSIANNSLEDINQNGDVVILECSEDVPFSPLRQSYTPIPATQQFGDPLNDVQNANSIIESNADNNLQIVDVRSILDRPSTSKDSDEHENKFNAERTEKRLKQELKCTKDANGLVIFTLNPTDKIEDAANGDETSETTEIIGNKLNKISSAMNAEYVCSSSSSIATSSSSTSSLSNAEPGSSQNDFQNVAGTSRMEYGITTFLEYNEQQDSDFFNTGVRVRLSPIPFVANNNAWNQRFSPSYTSFEETDKQSSYLYLDGCKTSSASARALSTDSLNIRTDEKMPAKGEISEQESNGDIEGSWSHQIYPATENDNIPRYTNSYDTTVARESWSLSNEQNLSREMENMSTILMKFTSMEQVDPNVDVKPLTENILRNAKDATKKEKTFVKARKYRCPVCSQIFATLKEKRAHLIESHDYQQQQQQQQHRQHQGITSTKFLPKVSKLIKIRKPSETITSASCSTLNTIETPTLIECKKEQPETVKPFTTLNNYLLSYNWSTLKAKPSDGTKDENKTLYAILDSGVNYVCKTCEEQFNSIRAYDIHMTTHPAECYTCGRTFKRWVNFSIHLKRHLNIREHRCAHCPKRFVLRQSMIEHMRIHSNEAPLKCSLCMKRFKRFSNLIQHRNRHHLKLRPQAKDFICSCGEVFHSQAKIAWHRETHDIKPKCCPYCRERFMHKNSLVRHIRLSHTERFHLFKRDSVECPYCKKKYIKSSLKMHMEQHKTSRTTYECTICNKTLTTKWNLKQHKWIHASRSSKPFKCTMCTKAFIRESEYISHMNTHKAIKPYTCDHCGCQFARKYNWLRHTREHETLKKFRCDTCGKDFHRAYYLKEHQRIHTGERPFECGICGKTSTTKTNHNKHVKIHHARDPLTAEA